MADLQITVAAETRQAQARIAQLETKVKSFNGQLKNSRRGANQMGEAVDGTTRGMSRFAKSGLQQTGYQLGDFAVQVGGGTSALQAFGQQGSQLLGIFGATGALLGAGVAIVAALGNAYMKSGAMVKDFSEELDDLNELVAESHALGRTSSEQFAFLAGKYGEVTGAVKGLFLAEKSLLELKLTDTFVKARKAMKPFREELSKANSVNRGAAKIGMIASGSMAAFAGSFEELARKTGMSETQLRKFAQAMPELMSMQDAKESLHFVNQLLEETGLQGVEGMEKLTQAGRKNVEMLLQYAQAGQIVNVTLQELGKNIQAVEMATGGLGKMFNLTEAANDNLAKSMSASMGAAFKDIMLGTKNVSDAFKNMAAAIINQLIDVLVIQQIVGSVGNVKVAGGGKTGGTGLAGILSGTSGTRAVGGQVTTGQSYLVGERGPEMFVPSASGTIMPNNKMGGGSGVVVNQTLNISTGVSQTVRAEIAQLMPQITEASKAAVMDARRRGGSFSKAF